MTGSESEPPLLIDLANTEVYECAATLLAVLAAPRNDGLCGELHASLCARALHIRYRADPDDWTPILVKPPHAFRDLKLVDRETNFVSKRIIERTFAARMAIAFLREVEVGQSVPNPEGVQRLSINEMAAFIADVAGQSDVANVKTRLWRPSLPVIHLAVAAECLAQSLDKQGEEGGIDNLLWSRSRVTWIVEYAETLGPLIAKCAKIRVGPAGLVRIRLV